jgi:F-type H+-transporting ATPase subunit delta
MMLSRTAATVFRRTAASSPRRTFSDAAAAAAATATHVKLSFTLPHETIYDGAQVHSVIVPGSAGEYGVTANHVPYVAQLKPGVLQILHEENTPEPEKYFVPGGYALTHEDSTTVRVARMNRIFSALEYKILPLGKRNTVPISGLNPSSLPFANKQDIVCPEAVKLDDIDADAVSKQFASAKNAYAAAPDGTIEQAEAQIDMEVNRAMGLALGMSLS